MGSFTTAIRLVAVALAALCVTPSTIPAADWGTWRGPTGDGRSPETGLDLVWGDEGPAVLWRLPVPTSGCGVSIVDDRVYTISAVVTERKQTVQRTVWCLEAATGRAFWQQVDEEPYGMGIGGIGNGTIATPIVDAGRVFVMGRRGSVLCLDAITGKPLWERSSLIDDYQLHPSHVGAGGAPTVVGDVLVLNICRPNGVGLDKYTGETRWVSDTSRSGWDEEKDRPHRHLGASHAGLIPYPGGGEHAVLFFAGDGLRSIDARSGEVHWFSKYGSYHNHNIPAPLVVGDQIVVCKKRFGLLLLDNQSGTPTRVYEIKGNGKDGSPVVGCGFLVHHQGFLYGVGNCFRLSDGALHYESPFLQADYRAGGDGGVVLVEDKLVMVTGSGSLIVAEADPDTFTPLCRSDEIFTPPPQEGEKPSQITVWAPPSLSNGRLFVRSTTELVCIDLRRDR